MGSPMSSDLSISASGLSKAYLIYSQPTDRLLQSVVPRLQRVVRPVVGSLGIKVVEKAYFSRHWALEALDFSVARGETLGVIGRNGSGKSTLLQLVCGTLTPTSGEVKVRGRVAALLELGSGFNPEYTGRENVFLNASVLGLTQDEILARIDDILAFADIGDFVNQPVKTYSSGMAMRLAFAVIAHVDADILIIDEALAVGDAYFQQKCLRWLKQFRETGTVLFCGHDTGAILSLCQRALWLDKGHLQMEGSAKDVCEAYAAAIQAQAMGLPERVVRIARSRPSLVATDNNSKSTSAPIEQAAKRALPPPPQTEPAIFDFSEKSSSFGSGQAEIVEARITASDGASLSWIEGGEPVTITVRVLIKADMESPIVGFFVKDRLGQPLLGDNTFLAYADQGLAFKDGQEAVARFVFDLPFLASGRYSLTVAIASGTLETHVQHHWLHDALMFDVHSQYRNGVMVAVPMREITLNAERPATDA
jgi:lipopolysaccharide transport system ATP-binding protein